MRKIIIEDNKLDDIPYMLFYSEASEKLPLVFLSHGFDNSKYECSDLAIRLAKNGLAAIIFDSHNHGERSNGLLQNIDSDTELGYHLFNTVKETDKDLLKLISFIKNDSKFDSNRLGLCGISLGGNLCYYHLANNDDIKVYVPIIGAPSFKDLLIYCMEKEDEAAFETPEEINLLNFVKAMDPYASITKKVNIPLLMINCSKDDNVPAKFATDFYNTVQSSCEEKQIPIELFIADEYHYVSETMKEKAVAWFKEYL